jgi:hypothetical protein
MAGIDGTGASRPNLGSSDSGNAEIDPPPPRGATIEQFNEVLSQANVAASNIPAAVRDALTSADSVLELLQIWAADASSREDLAGVLCRAADLGHVDPDTQAMLEDRAGLMPQQRPSGCSSPGQRSTDPLKTLAPDGYGPSRGKRLYDHNT